MAQNVNYNPVATIKVIGVGGGGNNSIKTLLGNDIDSVEFIVANTDKQALDQFDEKYVLHLGDKRGIGAGARPEIGYQSAQDSVDEIKSRIKGADLVVITAGMGGGTGTGASPLIAKIAKECGALVIAIVTTPFNFEGPRRAKIARDGIEELRKYTDSYIVISNQKLLLQYGDIPYNDAFRCVDNVLKQAVRTLIDVIAIPGKINLDFADLETIIKDKGEAVVGIGQSSGTDRAIKAITSAVSSPILESSIVGAKDAIVYFFASDKMSLNEIDSALTTMHDLVGQDMNIIFGLTEARNEESNKLGELFVSVIATGLKSNAPKTVQAIQGEIVLNLQKNKEIKYSNENTREFLNESPFHTMDFVASGDEINSGQDDIADILKQ